MDSVTQDQEARPVIAQERIAAIDVLRGFALCGVLLMNMQAFAMPFCAYMNPTSYGDFEGLGGLLWRINYLFADAKFITIFSMLFGAGILLMSTRAVERTGKSAGVHYRRMLWMALFGAIHGLCIWMGDILLFYSICGLIVFLFRRRRPWLLCTVGIVLYLIPVLLLANLPSFMEHMPEEEMKEMVNMWAPSAEVLESEIAAYRSGYLAQMPKRLETWLQMFGFLLIFGWRLLGVMLLGMAAFKCNMLSAGRSRRFYVTMVVVGFTVGIPLALVGMLKAQACEWDMLQCMGPVSLYNYFGSLFVAAAWIGAVMLLCKSSILPGLRDRLGAVGRMAFTNYIMHSVLCTLLFYGHGFGLYGRVGRPTQFAIVLGIIALQLWYSPLWLRHFKFGPLEWLWRSLTYWSRQPFRRAEAVG